MRWCTPLLLAVVLICSIPNTVSAQTADAVTRGTQGGIIVKIIELSSGYAIDASVTNTAAAGLTYKIFSNDRDITLETVATQPRLLLVYGFNGIDAAQQCRVKTKLDSLLTYGLQENITFTDMPNDICDDASVYVATPDVWASFLTAINEYRRILSVHLSPNGSGAFFFEGDPQHWANLRLSALNFGSTEQVITKLANFAEAHTTGFLAAVPKSATPDSNVTITFYRDGSEVASFSHGKNTFLSANLDNNILALGGGAAIFVILIVVILMRRKEAVVKPSSQLTSNEQPIRIIRIGFGPDNDYSLGDGAPDVLAQLEVYDDGRHRLMRVDAEARIEVNGNNIDAAVWVADTSTVRIAGRKIKFN